MKKGKEQLYGELLTRGVVEIISKEHLEKQLRGRKKLRIKLGIDPTGSDLHLGHSIPLRKLQVFAECGHTPVLIVGDWTARIGDPSGKDETRPRLTRAQVAAHAKTYLSQIGRVLDLSKSEVRYQSEWFDSFDLEKAIHLMAQMTFGQIMAHETFRTRVEKGQGLGMHELLYPLLQGYDSVAVKADVELGAREQKFNLLAGRELQKAFGEKPQDVMMVAYLSGLDGNEKMSKTLGNYIALNDTPEEMFGKVMSIPDALMKEYTLLLTSLPWDALGALEPREAKAALAKEIVAGFYDKKAADAAASSFDRVFRKKELPADIPQMKIPRGVGLIEALVVCELVSSKSEARRLIAQDGVRVNGEVVAHEEKAPPLKSGDVLQVGKRKFARLA